jgi:hypothetical protein
MVRRHAGWAKKYGVPFGGGSLDVTAKGEGSPDSWKFLDEKVHDKTTMDAAAFWDLCFACFLPQNLVLTRSSRVNRDGAFFVELEKLKMAKWYKDGAELAN